MTNFGGITIQDAERIIWQGFDLESETIFLHIIWKDGTEGDYVLNPKKGTVNGIRVENDPNQGV